MLAKLKRKICSFIMSCLLNDAAFTQALYLKLQLEKQRLDKAARDDEQRKRAMAIDAEKSLRQSACSHLKGGRVIGPSRDYAISIHTFPDGHLSVRCLLCSKEWKGEQLKLSEVRHMLDRTTNTKSASEFTSFIKDQKESPFLFNGLASEQSAPSIAYQIQESVNAWYKRKQEKLRVAAEEAAKTVKEPKKRIEKEKLDAKN